MVLIEAEQKSVGESWQKEQDLPVREEETAEVPVSYEKKGFFTRLANGFKKVFARLNFFKQDFRTIGMTPQQKADYYVKRCWNYMANNEAGKAKAAYENLVQVYEDIDEGPVKTNLYYEVYDIYERVSQIQ